MRTYITTLLLATTLILASCGGGNDVASSGASAVSAAASATTTTATASAPSTPATTATEPKVNGQIDERTGVAPVVAQMTVAPWCSKYEGFNVCGCLLNMNLYGAISEACNNAAYSSNNKPQQCNSLGGTLLCVSAECGTCIANYPPNPSSTTTPFYLKIQPALP